MTQSRALARLLILCLLAATFSWLSGCGGDKPTSPGGTNPKGCDGFALEGDAWDLEVYDPDDQGERYLMLTSNNYDPGVVPTVSLKIDGASTPLTHVPYGNWWNGTVSLSAGRTYRFELTVDGRTTAASLAIAFTPHAVFPEEIRAGQSAQVTWSMNGPAACQLAAAGSGDMQDDEDEFVSPLGTAARTFTFPAGCVPGWGDGETYLSLAIFNRTIARTGSCVFISSGLATKDYQSYQGRLVRR
jgi:hypothetical protein